MINRSSKSRSKRTVNLGFVSMARFESGDGFLFSSGNQRILNSCFNLNQTGVNLKRHAQSQCECFVDCLSRYLSLPYSGQSERGHGEETTRLLLQNARVQNDARADLASSMRARIAAWQLLHRFVLDA
jgi:hypothetical protein